MADYILGKLSREGSKLPNPYLLIRPFITREAVLSSKIEGTQATLGEILANEVGAHTNRNPDDLHEVQNYIVALDYGLERLNDLPLSLRLIVRYLAVNPFLTIKKISEHFNIAFTTAQRAIQKLETLGIISPTTDKKRDRVYCAVKILEILEEPTKIDGALEEDRTM